MQHHPWCCIFFVQLNDEALFSTSCQRRKSQETSINPGVSVEFDMNDVDISNLHCVTHKPRKHQQVGLSNIRPRTHKLTEPEMLVLFESSILVKHVSKMSLNFVANHL